MTVKNYALKICVMRYAKPCISIMTLFFAIFFHSCNEDEKFYPDPSIAFKTENGYVYTDTSLLLGDSILIGIVSRTNSDVALTHFHYSVNSDSNITQIDTGIYETSFIYDKIIVKGVAENEIWSFYVRDRDGRKSETISVKFVKDKESVYGDISHIPLVVLGAQNNTAAGSFYSLSARQQFNTEQAYNNQSLVNLLYYYDYIDADENTIASPGANLDNSVFPGDYALSFWTTKNTTRFVFRENISVEEFDAATNDSLIVYNTFEYASGKRKAKNLKAGDIYSFETDYGKKGLLKVINVAGTGDGSVEFEIKMQN